MTTEPTCAYDWNQYKSLQRSKMQRKENKSAPSCHHRHNMNCSPPTRCVSFLCVCTFFLCMSVSVCICVSFFDTYNINSNLRFWWDHWLVKTCHTVIDEVLVVSRVRSPQWKQTNKQTRITSLAGFFCQCVPSSRQHGTNKEVTETHHSIDGLKMMTEHLGDKLKAKGKK